MIRIDGKVCLPFPEKSRNLPFMGVFAVSDIKKGISQGFALEYMDKEYRRGNEDWNSDFFQVS